LAAGVDENSEQFQGLFPWEIRLGGVKRQTQLGEKESNFPSSSFCIGRSRWSVGTIGSRCTWKVVEVRDKVMALTRQFLSDGAEKLGEQPGSGLKAAVESKWAKEPTRDSKQ
jgi:hypothetical protein